VIATAIYWHEYFAVTHWLRSEDHWYRLLYSRATAHAASFLAKSAGHKDQSPRQWSNFQPSTFQVIAAV
jgi:hypothetical protein